MRGDFHIHTTYSDGTFSVEEVLQEASKSLDYLSITDHDNLEGSLKALEICQKYNLEVVIGVEVSTYSKDESVHILAYFNSVNDALKVKNKLDVQRNMRIQRCLKIKDLLLKYFKIDLDVTELLKISSITRGSIAREIIRQGFNYTKEEIFSTLIGDNCPAYLPSTKFPTIDAINMLKEANATIILAHPVLLKKNDYKDIVKLGVDGIEAIYPANTVKDTKKFKKYAKAHNLLITAGSDFHSFNDYMHGNIGSVHLQDEDLEKFINKIKNK